MHVQKVPQQAGPSTHRRRPIRGRLQSREITMSDTYNGMLAGALPTTVTWQKSQRSNPSGNCVEMARLPEGAGIAVRNSRDPEGPVLIYRLDEIAAFLAGARDGDFDNLLA
jgi:hypothetical protein